MSLYRVDKKELSVALFLTDGVVHEGVVFLSPFSPARAGRQTLLEVFREREPFFPFRDNSESFALVNKNAITHARYVEAEEEELALGEELSVRIVFFGGEVLQGKIRLAMPEGQNRLQDHVNAAPGFFPLEGGEYRYIVNGALIREIAPQR
ncbi:MAG: hypothetical protein A2091_05790 [Desulfuromonadales bacterium GWD2_61_12]|nr:MAG: hypothetical protein A2091_05790 [Desulfuromonadales bacterium GWD2_61_12]OGR33355.1 MAG: hypothetical protein A2005_02660 [Desulfuromonadales bacterium GWC2_61_20]HAD04163.1 hypothetical protein [Desulfuromonas sp.]HBT83042.1 hypothetical protein [Desulfuromonas sp.]